MGIAGPAAAQAAQEDNKQGRSPRTGARPESARNQLLALKEAHQPWAFTE